MVTAGSDTRASLGPTQLHHLVTSQLGERGQVPALTLKDASLTYAELAGEISACRAALRSLGARKGDRVAIYSDKRLDAVVAMFGSAAAGCIFVPVNPLLRPPQVRHILDDCEARVLIATAERLEILREELEDCRAVETAIVLGEEAPADLPGMSTVRAWDALLEEAGDGGSTDGDAAIDMDPAAILYTSGSTGKPKGVVLSHRNLIAGAESVAGYLGNSAEDRILAMLPLSFDAGFSQLTTGFAVGAQVVLVNYLLPRDVMKACAEHRITAMTGVPPLWIQLAELEWPIEATRGVRMFASTGGRMPRPTLDRLRSTFPAAEPYLMYGLTEAFRSTYLDPAEVDRRPDSIGKAIPNAEIFLAGRDGARCRPGERGELVHRGALVAMGYWGDPERTATRFRPAPGPEGAPAGERAVWSGDLAVEDEEGFLYFVERDDEMIKTSGYRVSPSEIEDAAYETGLVAEAAALGEEDPRLGQRIVLAIVLAAGEHEAPVGELAAALRGVLPGFMQPARIETLTQLPRSANGKFDRVALRSALGEA